MKKLTLLLLTLLLLSHVGGQSSEEVQILISSDREFYEAGDIINLKISFVNKTEYPLDIHFVEIDSESTITMVKRQENMRVSEKKTRDVVFRLRVKSLENGKYDVRINYSFTYITIVNCPAPTPVNVEKEEIFTFLVKNQSPHIYPESTSLVLENGEGILKLKNAGTTAKDTKIEIISSIELNYKSYLGYVMDGYVLKIKSDAKEGEYEGKLKIHYLDKMGKEYNREIPIKIVITKKSVAVSTSKIQASTKNIVVEEKNRFDLIEFLKYYFYGMLSLILITGIILGIKKSSKKSSKNSV